jgi:hypothetical protein
MAIIKAVQGFKPSTSGFHFSNSFPNVPLLTIDLLGQQIPIGDASNGMCERNTECLSRSLGRTRSDSIKD